MRPQNTIVLATSLTESSDSVMRTGAALARTTGATVWLAHAYFPYLPVTLPTGGGIDPRWVEEQALALRGRMLAQAERTGLAALAGYSPERIRLLVGAPHRELAELVREIGADLLVVGAAETAHRILGSTADRLVRKASCPVFVVRSEAAFPPARVEMPVDLSPISANALCQGLDLLDRLGVPAAAAEVLFVLNPFEVGGSVHFTQEQIHRFAVEELERFLAANAPAGRHPGAATVRTGYPREEILATLAERHVDLAVLGTQGLGGFERLMIGSVAAGVLRGAACNLLIVPPPADLPRETPVHRAEPAAAVLL
jgi:nucleotide-binding universal stress UspA family protein